MREHSENDSRAELKHLPRTQECSESPKQVPRVTLTISFLSKDSEIREGDIEK